MELPGIHDAADEAAARGQRAFLALSACRLISILVAALAGAFMFGLPDCALLGWVVLFAFVAAGVSEVLLIATQPERDWYAGRAIAESAKTLAWRYAVGGQPFRTDLDPDEAENVMRERLLQVVDQGKDRLNVGGKPAAVTPSMKTLRGSPFEVRRAAYLDSRTREQRSWYSRKAELNSRRATAGRYVLLSGEFVAVVAAALALQADRWFDFAGIVAALLASLAAWMAIKQHSQLTSAYRVAAVELSIQEDALATVGEDKWAQAVADAEEAISREHTMWLASRGNEQLPGRRIKEIGNG
jgi:hypothetical protein